MSEVEMVAWAMLTAFNAALWFGAWRMNGRNLHLLAEMRSERDCPPAQCEPCATYQHGGCQGHRVPCDCTCGEASDGGRLG